MNPTQACVVPFQQPSQQTVRSIAHRTQKHHRASVRYLSRSEYQRPQTDRLAQTSTQHSIETPQPRSLQEPSKSSSVNADLASDLSPAAWNNLGIALAGLEQYD
ncbi:MAG: hypothetical protein SWY16_24505, partial [Cyanobacteriota bacterium]|nr:hypothetical protein [Cyanobacteriota bacterium]